MQKMRRDLKNSCKCMNILVDYNLIETGQARNYNEEEVW